MKDSERYAEQKLEEALAELEVARSAYRSTSQRLAIAEEALRFYANPNTYLTFRDPILTITFQGKITGDYEDAANSAVTKIAGARARAYFRIHENHSSTRL